MTITTTPFYLPLDLYDAPDDQIQYFFFNEPKRAGKLVRQAHYFFDVTNWDSQLRWSRIYSLYRTAIRSLGPDYERKYDKNLNGSLHPKTLLDLPEKSLRELFQKWPEASGKAVHKLDLFESKHPESAREMLEKIATVRKLYIDVILNSEKPYPSGVAIHLLPLMVAQSSTQLMDVNDSLKKDFTVYARLKGTPKEVFGPEAIDPNLSLNALIACLDCTSRYDAHLQYAIDHRPELFKEIDWNNKLLMRPFDWKNVYNHNAKLIHDLMHWSYSGVGYYSHARTKVFVHFLKTMPEETLLTPTYNGVIASSLILSDRGDTILGGKSPIRVDAVYEELKSNDLCKIILSLHYEQCTRKLKSKIADWMESLIYGHYPFFSLPQLKEFTDLQLFCQNKLGNKDEDGRDYVNMYRYTRALNSTYSDCYIEKSPRLELKSALRAYLFNTFHSLKRRTQVVEPNQRDVESLQSLCRQFPSLSVLLEANIL